MPKLSANETEVKELEFHAFEFKEVIGAAFAASFVGLAAAVAIGYYIIFINSPMFFAIILMSVALSLTWLYGKYRKSLWKAVVGKKKVEIYRGGKLKASFMFSEIKKIKVNGWFRWELENAAKLLEQENEKKAEARPQFNVWETRNPYLIFSRLKKAYENSQKGEQGSHRSLTITTDRQKISIMLGNIAFVNTSDKREVLIFDRFLWMLENYAIKKKYEKIDQTFSLSPPYVKKYYYLRK